MVAGIKESSDRYVKAVGHNTLGYCYMEQAQTKDAEWEFLWVDVEYNQDRVQHAKALYHLWKLFDEVKKDKVKSTEYLEKLKLLDGTEYARMATMK